MGFQDRDYMQGGEKPPVHFRLPKLELFWWLLIITAFFSLLKIDAQKLFLVSLDSLKDGYVWTLILSLFAVGKAGAGFPLFSMLWHGLIVFFFGRTVIEIYGFKNFLFAYCLGAYASLIGYLGVLLLSGSSIGSNMEIVLAEMGANTIFMLYAFRYPKQVIYVFFVLPVQIRFLAGIYFLMTLAMVVKLDVSAGVIAVSMGSIFSMGTGLLLGWRFVTLEKISRFFKGLFRSKVKLPGGENFEDASTDQIKMEVDRLLGKVSDKGLSSLTEKEKAFLKKSSNRY